MQDRHWGAKILVANRGEIAIRICRAAADLGIKSVAVHSADDGNSLHTRQADEVCALPGIGVSAYLDIDALIAAAHQTGATLVHPGYGFLSERPDFARACQANGLVFVGPDPDALDLFGNKHAARQLAIAQNVPVSPGTDAPTSLNDAQAFLAASASQTGVMVKAVAGGGGRGIRTAMTPQDLQTAFARAASEAQAGFGNDALYVEQLISGARHIEVQIVGDGTDIAHFWDRDCTLQRRHQKLVEIAPAPHLDNDLRHRLLDAALRLGRAVGYRNLGTVEFLVDPARDTFFFLEVNPRLQVEHTVTEEITGQDLVALQIQIAQGQNLIDLGISPDDTPLPRGRAMQLRINAETPTRDGDSVPASGTLTSFALPSGLGIRTDSYGYAGYQLNPSFDSLLAKLVVHVRSPALPDLLRKAYRALCECDIAGVPTNLSLLQDIIRHPQLPDYTIDTGFLARESARLSDLALADNPRHFFAHAPGDATPIAKEVTGQPDLAPGHIAVPSPYHGVVASVSVTAGEAVAADTTVVVVEAMKMEYVITAGAPGLIADIFVTPGQILTPDQVVLSLTPHSGDLPDLALSSAQAADPDHIRPDLQAVYDRRAITQDANRPDAVARRRKINKRTARENLDDLLDPGSFVEYGSQVLAAQRRKLGMDALLTRSPADGVITGLGQVNGDTFGDPDARVAVMTYDATVFAGTQGVHNHWKTDRLIDVAEQGRLPFILFAEGGGGRPHDDDYVGFPSIDTFNHFSRLSALVPMIGIVSGRCFAGNAALLGSCDVIIATRDCNIGMGGPAMIEGGGLGLFKPEDIGPTDVQMANGVIDICVEDEAEAVTAAKRYLSYFQGRMQSWSAPDQRRMRTLVPENRLRIYDVRAVIETLADTGSMLEMRPAFGRCMVTAFVRVEGRSVGVLANDPKHLGGAIDSDASDKAARFMQICDSFDIPILNLCDTPGFMVGPEVEKTGLVRHAARMFLAGANLTVPFFTVILRKAYGLGAIAMAAGDLRAPLFTVAWPTGELGDMGLEGQVKLGHRAELSAIEDPVERERYFKAKVDKLYDAGRALEKATIFAIDETIDPAETRFWVTNTLASLRPPPRRTGKKRPMIDAW